MQIQRLQASCILSFPSHFLLDGIEHDTQADRVEEGRYHDACSHYDVQPPGAGLESSVEYQSGIVDGEVEAAYQKGEHYRHP